MLFIVVPVNGKSDMGFWVQADNANEARLLVSLNVPGRENAVSPIFASCDQDERFSPEYGAIIGGSGQHLHSSMRSWASLIDMNQDAFRHSARSRALKASMQPLFVGFPGLEKLIATPLR